MYDGFYKNGLTTKNKAYIFGAVIGVLITLLSMVCFSCLILFFDIDRAYAAPFASVSVAVGCYFASWFVSKKIGDKGYLTGLIIGLSVFIFITILSLALGNNLSLNTLFHFIIILLSSISGGIVGVNTKKNKKYI